MNQRERFEAAWLASEKAEGDHAVLMFERSEHSIGKYFDIEVEAAWKAWQLGEASGLELAFPLYQAINDLVALFGKHGVVDRRHAEVDALMDALYRIDGGTRMNTVEQIRALLAREVA